MSVKVSERTDGDLLVIVKAKRMAAHTLRLTMNEKVFPKRYRFTLTNKIVDKVFSIYTLLYEANEMYPHSQKELDVRLYNQRLAMAYCRSLMSMIEIAKETFGLEEKKTEYWISMIFEVRIMTAKWLQKDVERFKDKF